MIVDGSRRKTMVIHNLLVSTLARENGLGMSRVEIVVSGNFFKYFLVFDLQIPLDAGFLMLTLSMTMAGMYVRSLPVDSGKRTLLSPEKLCCLSEVSPYFISLTLWDKQ